ncbi:GNAT family N-acetyltransferase [Bacillus cereus]|uniref:GNAT family N-acetyltransferase n=1 Tax=Bacillus cereus TaxID=1396 RepID=UPI0009531938|nr:GNAT family N-acetyltransferase [Bacillus cereus]OLR24670.1 hypothetical protein BLD50_16270 [Bacillus cereus]
MLHSEPLKKQIGTFKGLTFRYLTSADAKEYQAIRLQALQKYPERYYRDLAEEENRSLNIVAKMLEDRNKVGNFILGAFAHNKLYAIIGFHQYEPVHINHKAYLYGCYINDTVHNEEAVYRLFIQCILDEAALVSNLTQIEVTATLSYEKSILEEYGFEQYGYSVDAIQVVDKFYDEIFYKKILKF